MIGTLPADFIQYYAHVLRIMQKLSYLYGWNELIGEDGAMDDETNHLLILFTGVMFGVNGAVAAVNKLSAQIASRVVKTLPQKALTKGLIYPIVKKVATILGVKMTKDVFAKGVAKVIPIVGGVVSGGITFASYMPMSKKFKKYLAGLKPADVKYYKNIKEGKEKDYYEVEFSDVSFKTGGAMDVSIIGRGTNASEKNLYLEYRSKPNRAYPLTQLHESFVYWLINYKIS